MAALQQCKSPARAEHELPGRAAKGGGASKQAGPGPGRRVLRARLHRRRVCCIASCRLARLRAWYCLVPQLRSMRAQATPACSRLARVATSWHCSRQGQVGREGARVVSRGGQPAGLRAQHALREPNMCRTACCLVLTRGPV